MIRRRRPSREVEFSYDSFLDLLANVIAIILRFILVAWIGARTYKGVAVSLPPPKADVVQEEPIAALPALPEPTDPLSEVLLAQRERLAMMQPRLLEVQRERKQAIEEARALAEELAGLAREKQGTAARLEEVRESLEQSGRRMQELKAALQEVQARGEALAIRMEREEKPRAPSKTYHYRTPISRPLLTEEVHFECHKGRVTLVDVGALLDEIRRAMKRHGDELKTRWSLEQTTTAVGAFRMRYLLERRRGLVDSIASPVTPDADSGFSYGLSRWVAEPVQEDRGETADEALKADSEFGRVMSRLDPERTAVTLWVYPDSFALYRELRNHLHDRGFVVAGRPLPEGASIAASRDGTASRGQ